MKHFLWLLCWASLYAQFDVQTELLASDANSISFNAYIKNNSSTSQTGLSLKYFVDESDQSAELVPVVDWSPIASVTASRVLEFNSTVSALFDFSSHIFAAGEEKVIQIRLHATDHSFMDHNNDFSFTDLTASKSSHSKIALLQNGSLVFGEQPSIPVSSSSFGSSSSSNSNPSALVKTQLISEHSNSLSFNVKLYNTGDIPLSNVKYSYFLNWADHTGHLVTEIDYSSVSGVVVNAIESPDYLATLQFQYPSSYALAVGDSVELQVRLHLDNHSTLDFSNDFSYQGLTSLLAENPFGEVFANGSSLYGRKPVFPIIPNEPQKVEVKTVIVSETDNQLSLKALVSNTSLTPLKEVVFTYYSGNHPNLKTAIDFSEVSGAEYRLLDGAVGKEIHIDFGEHIFASGETREIHFRIFKEDYSDFDYTQDHSYLGNNILGSNEHVATYVGGLRTFGSPPPSSSTDSDGDLVANVFETALGTDPNDATSFPKDENALLNFVIPSELSVTDINEDLVVKYDYSHIDGYSSYSSVPVRIRAGQITNGKIPTILAYHKRAGHITEPTKFYKPIGRIFKVNMKTTSSLSFPFPLPDYLNKNYPKERLYMIRYNGRGWSALPRDDYRIEDGSLYLTTLSSGYFQLALAPEIQSISGGDEFQVVSFQKGAYVEHDLYAIGQNDRGQLGLGSFDSEVRTSLYPIDKPEEMGEVVQISSGKHFTLLLDHFGKSWCWGENVNGQCGSLPDTISTPTEIPLSLGNNIHVTQVEAGKDFSLFVTSDGSAFTMGKNNVGQLGLGSIGADIKVATAIPNLSNVVKVVAGDAHAVALLSDPSSILLKGWGANNLSQIGLPNTVAYYSSPQSMTLPRWTEHIPGTNDPITGRNIRVEMKKRLVELSAGGDNTAIGVAWENKLVYFSSKAGIILLGKNHSFYGASSVLLMDDYKPKGLDTLKSDVLEYTPSGFHQTNPADSLVFSAGKDHIIGLESMYYEGHPSPMRFKGFAFGNNEFNKASGIASTASKHAYPVTWPESVVQNTIGQNIAPHASMYKRAKEIQVHAGDKHSAILFDNEFYRWGKNIVKDVTDGFKSSKVSLKERIGLVLYSPVRFTKDIRAKVEGQINSGSVTNLSLYINGVEQTNAFSKTSGRWEVTPSQDYMIGMNIIKVIASNDNLVAVANGVVNYQVNDLTTSDWTLSSSKILEDADDTAHLSFRLSVPAHVEIDLWKVKTGKKRIKTIVLGEKQGIVPFSMDLYKEDGSLLDEGIYGFTIRAKTIGLPEQVFSLAEDRTSIKTEYALSKWQNRHTLSWPVICTGLEKNQSYFVKNTRGSIMLPVQEEFLCDPAQDQVEYSLLDKYGEIPFASDDVLKRVSYTYEYQEGMFAFQPKPPIKNWNINLKDINTFYLEQASMSFEITDDITYEIKVYSNSIKASNLIASLSKAEQAAAKNTKVEIGLEGLTYESTLRKKRNMKALVFVLKIKEGQITHNIVKNIGLE